MFHSALQHPTLLSTSFWHFAETSYSSMAPQQELVSIRSPSVSQHKCVDSDLLQPSYSSSPSDISSSSSKESSFLSTSSPQPLHVICNAPLVAPIPLPYHSPSFLQFDLPDIDQDLSQPPFTTRRRLKRKHVDDNDLNPVSALSKRRMIISRPLHVSVRDRTEYKSRRRQNH
ncbi:hypothetical protein BDQ17DRAFT_1426205 [Cyathus striatus]|nr:hypothetical protein BDQ17DRAFT_1426205 [Cyathus striatus]